MSLTDAQWKTLTGIFADASAHDLNQIVGMFKEQRGRLSVKQAAAFRIGQRVMFVGRRGVLYKGLIKKINTKSVSIDTDCGEKWRVAPSLLKAA